MSQICWNGTGNWTSNNYVTTYNVGEVCTTWSNNYYFCIFCKMFTTQTENEMLDHLRNCEYVNVFFSKKKRKKKDV